MGAFITAILGNGTNYDKRRLKLLITAESINKSPPFDKT